MKLHYLRAAFLVSCWQLVCSQGQAKVIAAGDVRSSGAIDPFVDNAGKRQGLKQGIIDQ